MDWIATGRRAATRALPALVLVGGCLAAVAYAANGPTQGGGGAPDPRASEARPPRPLIVRRPPKVSTSSTAGFAFRASHGERRFQCTLDRGGWKACHAPLVFRGLAPGDHRFSVRAIGRLGRRGAAARFAWKLLEPKPFAIEPQLSSLGALYPGAPAQVLPLVLRNPNPVSIRVTRLQVAASADPPGCDSAANLDLMPSSASPAAPLVLPPGGSVSLPAAGASAPAIGLRDLPVNQDACRGARFPLAFSGEAHG